MTEQLGRLRMAALNIDGVLLNDTFSPVIHHFVTSRGGTYSADLERRIFSQPREVAGRILADACAMPTSPAETIAVYFEERERYLADHPVRVLDGAADLLRRLRALGLRTVCYGGLDAAHFERHLGHLADLFDPPRYVCTDGIRPGLYEIAVDIAGLACDEVVFIDDVARVAVGHPSDFAHGHQRQLMAQAGARHVVGSLDEIDDRLLRTVDAEARAGTLWGGVPGKAVV
jgi:FMN phosphatase YigB (HAD superfamily)